MIVSLYSHSAVEKIHYNDLKFFYQSTDKKGISPENSKFMLMKYSGEMLYVSAFFRIMKGEKGT